MTFVVKKVMDNWFNEKSLNDQKTNEKMIQYEKKGRVRTLIFDSIPIEIYFFPLPHTEIGTGNKIVHSYFEWINERIGLISDDGVIMTFFKSI